MTPKHANSSTCVHACPQHELHTFADAGVKLQPAKGLLPEGGTTLPIDIRIVLPTSGEVKSVVVGAKVYFCQDEDVCLFEEVVFRVPVTDVASSGESTVDLTYSLSPKAQTTTFPL